MCKNCSIKIYRFLTPWPTRYLPIARAIVSKKFGRASCHSSVQPCARTGAKCIILSFIYYIIIIITIYHFKVDNESLAICKLPRIRLMGSVYATNSLPRVWLVIFAYGTSPLPRVSLVVIGQGVNKLHCDNMSQSMSQITKITIHFNLQRKRQEKNVFSSFLL